ncbi:MAG: 3-methylcrotonyl-CoA carboxylase, partial [Chloroflexota bacterium]|nr:3-methylcrotonyl-CoA carboxylase [Chloroflexota bacterium]
AALHVQVADEAYCIGPAPALESYLNIPAVLDAAKQSGAEAIHPGYGFLSENAGFAQAVADAGLVFIGPPPAAIRSMGDKAGAKRLMEAAGVPTVPGYTGDDQSDTVLVAEAERIGFPLLIKAVAGGGGMGMREVHNVDGFADALAAARRTAHRAFGDDRVLLERLILRPRHVEVQIFADARGSIVSLGERECSIQRRHQKVVEESPSPAVSPTLRQRLAAAAIVAAQTAGYVNAGTVEFLLDSRETFFFLEMNTRLQVEHPVTEGVTGLDLVRLQVEIAAGQPLPFTQNDIAITGHAIECRVYAEDPEQGYLPQTGTVTALAEPDGPGLRIDGSLYAGATVTPYYDPLLAKVIAHGATRDEAIARMQAALAGYRIDGIVTNLPQLRAIVATDAFRAGDTHTGFLTEHWHPSSQPNELPPEILLAIVGYEATCHTLPSPTATNPWQSVGPLRFGSAQIHGVYESDGARYTLHADRTDDDRWRVSLPASLPLSFARPSRTRLLVHQGATALSFTLHEDSADRDAFTITWRDRTYLIRRAGLPSPDQIVGSGAVPLDGATDLKAPLTGIVTRVLVQAGEQVQARQPLVVLEAMKMEHTIAAPGPARVHKVHATQGDRVAGGAVLVELEAAPSPDPPPAQREGRA